MKKLSVIFISLFFITLIGCGESEKDGAVETKKTLKIGFAAYSMEQEWYQNIANGAKVRADEMGVELLIADSKNDANTQVQALESFIAQGVDAIIVSPVDTSALKPVVATAIASGIKIISESNSFEDADTTIGQTDIESGYKVGKWYAEYAKNNNIKPKILILGYAALQNCRDRVEGFKSALDDSAIEYQVVMEVDGGFREASLDAATDAFTAYPDINVVFGINDDSSLGAGAAIKTAGLDQENIVNIVYGLEGIAGRTALSEGGMYKAGMAMFPEYVGVSSIDAALAAINGEQLPKRTVSPTTVIPAENFNDYFIKNGDKYDVNFEAVANLVELSN